MITPNDRHQHELSRVPQLFSLSERLGLAKKPAFMDIVALIQSNRRHHWQVANWLAAGLAWFLQSDFDHQSTAFRS